MHASLTGGGAYMRFAILAIVAVLGSTTLRAPELRREALMSELRNGGYTILLRHARTDRTFNEQRDPVPVARADQRNLNEAGIADSKLMGVVFKKYGIPLGEVIASPMYRTMETAEMAAGKPASSTMALRAMPPTPEQASLVAKPPKPGTNRLLVTHHFVIELHVPGIKPGDINESEAAVVRHTADGKVELVGKILLDDWAALADPATAKPLSESKSIVGMSRDALIRLHSAPAPANDGRPAVIPDTHAGHIAREYVDAFNSGSPDRMKAFIEGWMTQDPARPMDARLKTYAQLFEEHGPLTLTAVHASESLEVTLGMKSKRGEFRLTVKSSPEQPMRGTSVRFAFAGSHP